MKYVIMDISTGDLVGGVYETREEADEYIKNRDNPCLEPLERP